MSSTKRNDGPTIRAFIAIEISDKTRQALGELIRELKPAGKDVKWVRPEGMHLTLKFLGNIPQSLIGDIRSAMGRAAEGIEPFEVTLEGTGAFPNLRKPRVFWAGVTEESGRLAELASRLELELKPLGFEPEKRAFKSHLTIGRVRQGGKPKTTADSIGRESERSFGHFKAVEVALFKSDLRPDGAVYTRLEKVSLRL